LRNPCREIYHYAQATEEIALWEDRSCLIS